MRSSLSLMVGLVTALLLSFPLLAENADNSASFTVSTVLVVKPSSSYYMAVTDVTQAQYQQITGTNPSHFQGADLPVEFVDWFDAVKFCNLLSIKDGLDPVYDSDNHADLSRNGWRLPTNAEWKYAAEGGTKSHGFLYAGSNTLGDVAWYSDNSDDRTHPVATKQPNELGLYDMNGNVWQWGNDEEIHGIRVMLGGSYGSDPTDVLSENGKPADQAGRTVGFRILRNATADLGRNKAVTLKSLAPNSEKTAGSYDRGQNYTKIESGDFKNQFTLSSLYSSREPVLMTGIFNGLYGHDFIGLSGESIPCKVTEDLYEEILKKFHFDEKVEIVGTIGLTDTRKIGLLIEGMKEAE